MRKLPDNFNWVTGIDQFKSKISIIAGTCGALSDKFQKETNMKTITNCDLYTIQDAGHLSLFTTHAQETMEMVSSLLD